MSESRRLRPYPSVAGTRGGDRHEPEWEMVLTGDLGDRQSDILTRLTEVRRSSRGIIYFDTSGGSVYAGLAAASLICLRGLNVAAVVAGECSSAGLLPFAACRQRYVTPHSTLLFHPMRWQSEEDVRLEEAAEWTRHFRELEADLDQLLARLLDCPAEQLLKWTRPGRFVNGRELAEAGLAHLISLTDGDVWRQMAAGARNAAVSRTP